MQKSVANHPYIATGQGRPWRSRKAVLSRVGRHFPAQPGSDREIPGLDVFLRKLGGVAWEADVRQARYSRFSRRDSFLGYPRAKWLAPGFRHALVHPEDRLCLVRAEKKLLAAGGECSLEYRLCAAGGAVVWVRDVFTRLGNGPRLAGVMTDISAEVMRRRWLGFAEQSLPHTAEAVLVMDPDWKILRVNPAFVDITGYEESEARGQTPRLLISDRQPQTLYEKIGAEVAEKGSWSGEFWCRREDGSLYRGRLAVNRVHDAAGKLTHYVAVHSDLSRSRSNEELIRQLTDHDALTGLPNRVRLQEILNEKVEAAAGERQVVLITLDVDRFRTINEGLGYQIGDFVLQALAERLVRHAGPNAVVARRGGDEFCILPAGLESRERVATLATRLLAAVAEPLRLSGQEYALTASAGVSLYPEDAGCAASLLRYADVATDFAKQAGRNNFQFFSPAMKSAIDERLILEKGLRHAVERSQLMLHYQPIIDLARGRVAGVEALVRWLHPELGLVSPARFIPLAEETGAIVDIGEWVLREACQQGRRWHEAGCRGLQVAVNLSPLQFRQHNFSSRVAAILAESGFDPACLDLEITEGAIMQEPDRAAEILRQLKADNIRVSLDDFGTGYSSLAYLKRFPIDRLKIDQSFVRDCHSNRHDAAIVDTVIRLALNLEMEVLAEGVETQTQLMFLRDRRCDFVQGYLFSRPVPANQIQPIFSQFRKPAILSEDGVEEPNRSS